MNSTKHADLVARTQRIAAFAQLELETPPPTQLDCGKGIHFVVLTIDMDDKDRGWDVRSTFCREHAARIMRTMATVLEREEKTEN